MIKVNPYFSDLQDSYLFSRIKTLVDKEQAKEENNTLEIIKLGIGDVTKALVPAVVSAFHAGVDDMASDESFCGYGPENGYEFLRSDIAKNDFQLRGIDIHSDEIIVSDGSKCDTGNFQELFDHKIKVAVPDPVYPVYVDTNVMAGRAGAFKDNRYDNLVYLDATKENDFIPSPPKEKVDLLYLCFPNNPTGAVASKEQLQAYVDYALEHKALILFDAAYCEYIKDAHLPRSIFEIKGAKQCAVEFRSFSKTAGFTGTRCAYVVICKECRAFNNEQQEVSVRDLWIRRHSTKFNGVSYPVQRAAQAVYCEAGKQQIQERIEYYMENARIIRKGMLEKGFEVFGGQNSPFIWIASKSPSWQLFEQLLSNTRVVTTPGAGFGKMGEGYIRISAFNHREKVEEAIQRLKDMW